MGIYLAGLRKYVTANVQEWGLDGNPHHVPGSASSNGPKTSLEKACNPLSLDSFAAAD